MVAKTIKEIYCTYGLLYLNKLTYIITILFCSENTSHFQIPNDRSCNFKTNEIMKTITYIAISIDPMRRILG